MQWSKLRFTEKTLLDHGRLTFHIGRTTRKNKWTSRHQTKIHVEQLLDEGAMVAERFEPQDAAVHYPFLEVWSPHRSHEAPLISARRVCVDCLFEV